MSIITNEIEERYPYPDNGERPTGITSLGQCLASRKAYRAAYAARSPIGRSTRRRSPSIRVRRAWASRKWSRCGRS